MARPLSKTVNSFGGLNTAVKDIKTLSDGVSPDSLNWITSDQKDAIILRRGVALLGQTDNGVGKVTGLNVLTRFDGEQVPIFTAGRKIRYYNATTDNTAEAGSDAIPAAASGIDNMIAPYQNLAGSFGYITSPSMSAIKMEAIDPATPINQNQQDFYGYINFYQTRSFLWQKNNIRNQKDKTNLYLSWADKILQSDYPETTAETFGAGNGSTKTFAHTLTNITGVRSAFYVRVAGAIATGVSITGITAAAQAVVTVASHSLVVGDPVLIFGVLGMTQINSLIGYVTAITATTITLDIDSHLLTAYSSGGTIYKAEVLTDDRNGAMSSPAGGSGTANYATGAISATFFTAPLNTTNVITEYNYEDATSEGVLDFSISTDMDGARIPFTGDLLSQFASGGTIELVLSLASTYFSFHDLNTWQTTIPLDDSAAGRTNLPFREKMAVPTPWGGCAGQAGIYFIDTAHPGRPQVRLLQIFTGGSTSANTYVPKLISEALDLSQMAFNYAAVYEWGQYVLLACAQIKNGAPDSINTRTFLYNTLNKCWDLTDYPATRFATYAGTLLAGSPVSNNIYTLFSGFDDEATIPTNYWTSKRDDLSPAKLAAGSRGAFGGQKKFHYFSIDGLIQTSQNFSVSFSFDGGAWITYFVVDGTGSYVDSGTSVAVGANTVGSKISGGGATVLAHPFEVQFKVASDRLQDVRVRFQANSGGYVQINKYSFEDIRLKTSTRLSAQNQG